MYLQKIERSKSQQKAKKKIKMVDGKYVKIEFGRSLVSSWHDCCKFDIVNYLVDFVRIIYLYIGQMYHIIQTYVIT